MRTIPNDLLDAPRRRGAELRIWAQIVMPLCVPALAALGIFTFTYQWDNFYWPLVIVSSEDLRTRYRSGWRSSLSVIGLPGTC